MSEALVIDRILAEAKLLKLPIMDVGSSVMLTEERFVFAIVKYWEHVTASETVKLLCNRGTIA